MVDIYLHPQFLNSFTKLSKEDQSRVHATLHKLLSGHQLKGLRRHEVEGFISFSISMDLRLLAWPATGGNLLLAHVDHHDSAYAWAKRHKVLPDSQGRPVALIELIEQQQSVIIDQIPEYHHEVQSKLLVAGFPESLARYFAGLSNQTEMLQALEYLAPEAQEVALAALVDSLSVPFTQNLPSNIFVVTNDKVLEWALQLPTEYWRLFLHPKQRYAIEIPPDRHILLRGGPGTGKTITLLHRYVRLFKQANTNGTWKPALVALNAPTRKVLIDYLNQLGINDNAEAIIEAQQLPKQPKPLRNWLQDFSCLLIDEAQDLPLRTASSLLTLLEDGENIPGLFLSYDVNQAIINPSGEAFSRLERYCNNITLTYCYRASSQIADFALQVINRLHTQYKGKDFQHQHEIASTRDTQTSSYTTVLQGPQVLVQTVLEPASIVSLTASHIQNLRGHYADDNALAVLVVSDAPSELCDNIVRLLQEMEIVHQILTPNQAKGHEFFAGVVIDILEHDSVVENIVSRGRYRTLSALYVAISRFRDQLVCLVLSPSSPLKPTFQTKGSLIWKQ